MEILRTDDLKTFYRTDRTDLLHNMFIYHDLPIISATDDKGGLIVNWETYPSPEKVELVNNAWRFLNETVVIHKINGMFYKEFSF